MNTQLFLGKAHVYASSRPGYPTAAIEYICNLVPPNVVFADIGAGTGQLTEPIAKREYPIFAVEPNTDIRQQLAVTMSPYANATVVNGSAEATALPDNSVDVIICAQALHWFDFDAFRAECKRIGKEGCIVVAVYNVTLTHPNASFDAPLNFFHDQTIQESPNPLSYTREKWLEFMHTHSHSPLPSDPNYDAHIAEANEIFDNESIDGLIHRDIVTKIYYAKI